MKNTVKNFVSALMIIGTASYLAPEASQAETNSCSSLMRHNVVQGLKSIDQRVSESSLRIELCDSTSKSAKTLLTHSSLNLDASQTKAVKALLCDGKKNAKKMRTSQRVIKDLIGADALQKYNQCLAFEKKGISLMLEARGQQNDLVNLTLKLDKPGITVEQIMIDPPQAFSCSGPLSAKADRDAFNHQTLLGSCKRDPAYKDKSVKIAVRTSAGTVKVDFAPDAVDMDADLEQVGREPFPALPNIQECRVVSQADRILECSEYESWQRCNNEMARGNVLDCRVVYPRRVFRGIDEVQIRPARRDYQFSGRNTLRATAVRNFPIAGSVSGTLEYTINFETPVRPPSPPDVCDPNSPILGAMGCNRDCVFADHIPELPQYFGVAGIFREDDPSCTRALTGQLELSSIDRFRAYNLCESRNAWGGSTRGILYAQVSKFYYFNDFRTRHETYNRTVNGRVVRVEEHSVSNHGERVRAIAELEVQFDIDCTEE